MNSENNPNPQGKGLVPVLQQWQNYQPLAVKPKPSSQLFVDYFISLLILSAHFKFKPVIEKEYYLYFKNQQWRLSMIEPTAWRENSMGDFLGSCILQPDMTWQLTPDKDFKNKQHIIDALGRFNSALIEHLDNSTPLKQKLPYYAEGLPFYQRMAANGLAKSISLSADTDILENSGRNWLNSLPQASLLEL